MIGFDAKQTLHRLLDAVALREFDPQGVDSGVRHADVPVDSDDDAVGATRPSRRGLYGGLDINFCQVRSVAGLRRDQCFKASALSVIEKLPAIRNANTLTGALSVNESAVFDLV